MQRHNKSNHLAHLLGLFNDLLPEKEVDSDKNLIDSESRDINENVAAKKDLDLVDFIEFTSSSAKAPIKILNYFKIDPLEFEKHFGFAKLYSKYFHRSFPVEIGEKYTDRDWRQEIMSFGEFYDTYSQSESKAAYIAQYNIFQTLPELATNLIVPEYCLIGSNEIEINFWIGLSKTITPFHFDKKDNIFYQLVGQKYLILIAPEEFPFPLAAGFTNTSDIDLKTVIESKTNLKTFAEVLLKPGEILYIPKGWWHYCESLSKQSISVSCWF